MKKKINIFDITEAMPGEEIFEPLIPDRGVLIERIVSHGAASPPDYWYNQKRDEWVVLLQGEATIDWGDGTADDLNPGDWIFIPSGKKHRVEKTSINPPAIWLAVHGSL